MPFKSLLPLAMSLVLFCPYAPAQAPPAAQSPAAETHAKGDISGDWQGTLEAGKSLRVIVKIARADKGFTAKFYSIDQAGVPPLGVSSIGLDGNTVKFTVDIAGASYTGTLSADATTITGTWTQGPAALPLNLVRATKETAWEVPAPAAPQKPMAADADPAFDVATIKPNGNGATSMQGLGFGGRSFMTQGTSLLDLISFAYEVQKKQIAGAPDWADRDRYDISAVPDTPGAPNVAQMRTMLKKLLADRYGFKFHEEKREMPAFVLTVAKGGPKMKETEIKSNGPGFGLRPQPGGVDIPVINSDMRDFAMFLQSFLLDRPVVNQTALTGRFDFTLKFTPDDTMFNGHPPPLPARPDSNRADTTEVEPSLFEAIQQQIGLKLDAQKTPVTVIAIDHVDKPTAN
jgi:uncharacterized protein (TIGR03435 family)